jgi:hypothetical protein
MAKQSQPSLVFASKAAGRFSPPCITGHCKAIDNCDIDFFTFRNCVHIMRLKFLKFERDQNAAENFQIGINESMKL